MQIKEHFLQVCNVHATNGGVLEKIVIALLEENDVKLENIWGQGYDGDANMSGHFRCLQSRILKRDRKALYVHCQAHCLNLVLVESAKANICFVSFFNLVETLYTFVANSSKRHSAFIEMQKTMYPLELQKLSQMRWACRETALRTLRKVLPCHAVSWGNDTARSPRLFSRWCNDPSQEHQLWILPVSGDYLSNLPDDCNGFWCFAVERHRPGCSIQNCWWSFSEAGPQQNGGKVWEHV